MTKLSNVVGGLMRDLAQSHTISDAFTVEMLETYRREATLSQLPLPRMSIQAAQLTLRFAVSSVQDDVKGLDRGELGDLWLRTVRDRVMPKALMDVGRIDNKRLVDVIERRLDAPDAAASVDPESLLAEGREAELTKSTISYLTGLVEALPPSSRKSFDNTDLAGSLERIVRAEIPELRAAAQQLDQARRAAQADLSVSVTTEALAAVPDGQISELTLTLTMEEIQMGSIPTLGGTDA